MKASPFLAAFAVGLATVQAMAAPQPPEQVRVRTMNGTIEVNWLKSPDDPLSVSGYEVVRGIFPSGPYQQVCVTFKGAVSCVDRRVQPEKRYYYRIRALGIGDEAASVFTQEVSAELPSPPPVQER